MAKRLSAFYVSFEAVPFAKVGGLADVAGALPRALAEVDVDATLVVPRFGHLAPESYGLTPSAVPSDWSVGICWQPHPFRAWEGRLPNGLRVVMIGDDRFFGRYGIYNDESGRPFADELERYVFFSKAVVEFMKCRGIALDIVHVNDYHTAPIAAYLRALYPHEPIFRDAAVIYSIHNMAHQGAYAMGGLETIGFDPAIHGRPYGPWEVHGSINLMKAGIHYADIVNTVSPSYAREIMTPAGGVGLDEHLRRFQDKVHGILNGIDVSVWHPSVDRLLPERYDRHHLGGKARAKAELFKRARLSSERLHMPLIGMVGRLVAQKGVDLALGAFDALLGTDVNLIALGSGTDEYENGLKWFGGKYPDRCGVSIGFDNELAHLITAASDIFLMPSRYEPCGLNQMYALAYGAAPVVRRTGGLADTVQEWNPWTGEGTGFLFDEPTVEGLSQALGRAIGTYWRKESWQKLIANGMSQDHSWRRSAGEYRRIYELAIENRRRYLS